MQVDEAEECNMRNVADFESELKQRCVRVVCAVTDCIGS